MTLDELLVMREVSHILAERCKRILPDGREGTVIVRMYNVQLVVGEPGALSYENGW